MTSDGKFYFVAENTAFSQEQIRVTSGHFRQIRIYGAACVLAAMAALASAGAQSPAPAATPAGSGASGGMVQGYVRDSSGRPLANASVSLQLASDTQTTRTNSEGAYRFTALLAGAYALRATMDGYSEASIGPVSLAQNETRKIDLSLDSIKASEPQNAPSGAPATQKPQRPSFLTNPSSLWPA